MAGNDSLLFNSLERALSSDLNDTESIAARYLAELLRYTQSSKIVGDDTESIANVVPGGLAVTPSGSDVQVGTGVLLQDSASLAPAPGTYDSTYRMARNSAPLVVVMPAPGVETYYLVEAQMVEVTTLSTIRDVFNVGTQTFVPTLVAKVRERRIATQVIAGTPPQAPAPSGGNWVPLAVVRRPGGGGAVVSSDIFDVRRRAEYGRERPIFAKLDLLQLVTVSTPLTPSNAILLSAQIDGARGVRAADAFNLDVSGAAVIDPTSVLAANQWSYLYLVPWSALGLTPRVSVNDRQGVLVLSTVAPIAETRLNSAVLNLPAPWNVAPAGVGVAYCAGALRRNAANTGWIPMFDNLGAAVLRDFGGLSTSGTSAPAAASFALAADLGALGWWPGHARAMRLRAAVLAFGALGGGPTNFGLTVRRTGEAAPNYLVSDRCGLADSIEFTWPRQLGNTLTVDAALQVLGSAGGTADIAITLTVMGWEG